MHQFVLTERRREGGREGGEGGRGGMGERQLKIVDLSPFPTKILVLNLLPIS